jgi:hypothetical protein
VGCGRLPELGGLIVFISPIIAAEADEDFEQASM